MHRAWTPTWMLGIRPTMSDTYYDYSVTGLRCVQEMRNQQRHEQNGYKERDKDDLV